ncbi:Crp/Fnr family transcriptional regulator [Variovorax sp. PBL-E5]|uniref:Crp/Fnr family transcriptional regulator n=1 Tax=Variovorax sp. PBL-E5 TaxID=434014 RepID=UPI00131703A0|nr:Crp/Fnr family transcriptional regulator [Variovorax sp. PBL-E5]VTU39001.1 cAMP regulatory protein [Variovorax sp. PBL-E5]
MSIYATWDGSLQCTRPWLDARGLGERVWVPAGTTLSEAQAVHGHFHLIRAGYISATMARANGAPLLLEILGPGTLFGAGPAFERSPRFATTFAITDCTLDCFDAATVESAFGTRPELAVALIRLMNVTQRSLARKLMRFTSSTPEERLLELLARVSRVEQLQNPRRGRPQVHLTHDQLAAMSGLSRVTVTRTLKKLATQGLVQTQPGHVEVLRPDLLERRVEGL